MTNPTVFVANCQPTGQTMPSRYANDDLVHEIVSLTDRFTAEDLNDLPESDLEKLRSALSERNDRVDSANSFPSLTANTRAEERPEQQQSTSSGYPSLSAPGRLAQRGDGDE